MCLFLLNQSIICTNQALGRRGEICDGPWRAPGLQNHSWALSHLFSLTAWISYGQVLVTKLRINPTRISQGNRQALFDCKVQFIQWGWHYLLHTAHFLPSKPNSELAINSFLACRVSLEQMCAPSHDDCLRALHTVGKLHESGFVYLVAAVCLIGGSS